MRRLPETIRTDAGLSVEGASPELLRDLLVEYERELMNRQPEYVGALSSGRDSHEIVTALESAGIAPAEELIVWWKWHDGVPTSHAGGYPRRPHPLAHAVGDRDTVIPPHSGLSGEGWVPILGDSRGIAVRLDAHSAKTIVRYFEPGWEFGAPEPPFDQAVSLCTPVTWWIHGLREGWQSYDPGSPVPWWTDVTSFPMEWRRTELL